MCGVKLGGNEKVKWFWLGFYTAVALMVIAIVVDVR